MSVNIKQRPVISAADFVGDAGIETASEPSNEPLFRREVLAERQTQWLGTVLLEPRISSSVFAVSAALATLAVLCLLAFGSYARKAQINGWLVPQLGLARIFAPQPGVVTQLHVHEGMKVTKGDALISLSSEVQSQALGATHEEVVRRLKERRQSVITSKDLQEKILDQQAKDLKMRLEALKVEAEHLTQGISLQRDRLQVSKQGLLRERAMQARELISLTRLQRTEQEHLEQAGRLEALERNQAMLQRDQIDVHGQLRDFPLRRQKELAEIERSIASLSQELAEAEAKRQSVIAAPTSGIVTAIQVEVGSNAQPNTPLLQLVPEGTALEAHLFSPSRAIGFVLPGQKVRLRYQAFPYQKFGSYDGVVKNISGSAVSPQELSQQISGWSNIDTNKEPVYRIVVSLAQQGVNAYGNTVPLQPGMLLEADVIVENRSLIEWVLDPLYSLTGKLGK